MIKTMTLMTLAALLTMTSAMAKHGEGGNPHSGKDPLAAPGIEKRAARQKAKIQKKLSKGKLTEQQASELTKQVEAVEAKKQEMSADGKLSREERTELRQGLNQSKDAINAAAPKKPKKEETPAQ